MIPPNLNRLENTKILAGLTGSIAIYKALHYLRKLKKKGAKIIPVMTKSATKFVSPMLVSALLGEKCYTEIFEKEGWRMSHVNLIKDCDLMVILPATANFIAKATSGICNDLLSTLFIASNKPTIFFPAMNPRMLLNPITQKNINTLKEIGHIVIDSDKGHVACGDRGPGRLPNYLTIEANIIKTLTQQTLSGKHVLVTAGPTREPIDPVRFISNRSSGKMGISIAKEAYYRGANVTLIQGPTKLKTPQGINTIQIETADQLLQKCLEHAQQADIIVMTAAVSDYKPESTHPQKLKKTNEKIILHLEKNPDILETLRNKFPHKFIVGFAAETENIIENAKTKLHKKQLDLIIANDVSKKGIGFDSNHNEIFILDKSGSLLKYHGTKTNLSVIIWNHIENKLNEHL